MRCISLPWSMEEYLATYKAFNGGLNPTVKMKENVILKVNWVKSFLVYMAHSHSRLSDWLFLDDPPRIHGWSRRVLASGVKVTTAEYYLKNAFNFVNYMRQTPSRTSHLTQVQLVSIARELQMGLKTMHHQVVVHQMATKRSKVQNLPLKEDIKTCLSAAAKRIPQLLDTLEEDHSYATRFLFYGYQCAYWSCLFGHRPGVFANMTDAEVVEAKLNGGQQGYLIHIKEHKTNRTFGEAQLYLRPDEFSWVERWQAIKGMMRQDETNKFLLFTKGKGPAKNLNNCLMAAWKEMGLKGAISFTLIRTALATYAKKSHNTEARKRVSHFMCHDVCTTDMFYVTNPDHSEVCEIRRIIAESLSQDAELPSTSGVSEWPQKKGGKEYMAGDGQGETETLPPSEVK